MRTPIKWRLAGTLLATAAALGGALTAPAANAAPAATAPVGLSPANLQQAYDLQGATGGSGQTVAVVTPYGDPTAASDLATYRSQYGLAPCTDADGCFRQVSQTGSATSLPAAAPGWSAPVSMSVDAISAICPNCHITVVEANSTAITDIGAAEDEAVALGAKEITNDVAYNEISLGSGETSYDSYFDHPGVAITAPADDRGYGYVSYPAASPYVIAVGGTTLTPDSSSPRGYDETALGSSSGCSAYEPKPAWQTDPDCGGKALNDLSAVATGVPYYDTTDVGGWSTTGVTAVSAAIIAAIYAMAGTPGASDNPAGYPYEHPGGSYTTPGNSYPYADGLYNITTGGSNGTCTESYLCNAGVGYNGPTGLGSPASTVALTSAGGEAGYIFNGLANMCLNDAGGATVTGTHVQVYQCNGGDTDWSVNPNGTVSFGTGNCLANSTVATTGGYDLVDLEPCSSSAPTMQWQPRSNGSLYNPATGWCLADPGASTANGTQVIVGTCNGSASQQWQVPYTRPAFPGAIQAKLTTKLCISDAGGATTNGNPVDIWACNADAAQNGWTVAADGTLQYAGKCAVPSNAGTADGTPIVLWACEGETTQYWTERSDGTFVNRVSGTCLTDTNGNTTNGTQLVLLHCSASEGWTPHGES